MKVLLLTLAFQVRMDLRRRNRTAPDPSFEVPIYRIPINLHRNERSYDLGPSDGPPTRRFDFLPRPAVRCPACEVAHESPTIAQHPIHRPMALGSSTVITEVLRPNVRSGSEDEVLCAAIGKHSELERRWIQTLSGK